MFSGADFKAYIEMDSREISVCFILLISHSQAFIVLMGTIPNGNTVPHPCRPGIWSGVGHLTAAGGGLQNKFGADFELNGFQWNSKLCRGDSDGDGRSNGLELGDPNCSWRIGRRPRRRATGHPGVCEPVNSVRCRRQISPCGRNRNRFG